ncbi:hypothetical protein DLP05_067 [Stenotrophomonas phage vB_SmaS_DLP_5]|uniref:Uncharacterized protein n=1 Tax=Stenotrophomonas phage vB_SmaS_DLP_5 TaxID=2044561 RepID=A0A2D2W2E3_9CAUD|nr:hypothetical protein FDJ07_gp066 [Stenotrophomonas phage vB_SmaS_DLP_5]ATS92308.1 hypothetical protein DLP05_067 [Stenotrophomonas phage vB_SmaS_DLP_5]
MSENEEQGGSQVQEAAPQEQVVTAGKTKVKDDLFVSIAQEIEGLSKTKALNLADKLNENIEVDYFRLGGVLKVIYENTWFEGHESFGAFVADKFGFAERKAKYLMEIYDHLVTKQIPFEKVSGLGWTKLKDLARHLTLENVDEWVAKALPLTVSELQALLKGSNGDAEGTTKVTSDEQTLKFKFKNDQVETVTSALNKAKAEVNTTYDTVALEAICTGYLGGSVGIAATGASLEEQMKSAGAKGVLELFDQLFPSVEITIDSMGEEG